MSIDVFGTNQMTRVIDGAASCAARWDCPPKALKLQGDEAHVWLAPLDEENTAGLLQIISEDERTRAERFQLEKDKRRFIAARGLLRVFLGKYLEMNPGEIRFGYARYGKPFIAGNWPIPIKFNLSHSNDLALFAFTLNREIGVDLESIKPSWVDEGIINYCLTRRETKFIRALTGNDRDSFFFDCWTLKEAYLKACGTGLSLPANQIETSLPAEFSIDLPQLCSGSRQSLWSFQKLPAIPGSAAALAIEGSNPQWRFWRHQPSGQ